MSLLSQEVKLLNLFDIVAGLEPILASIHTLEHHCRLTQSSFGFDSRLALDLLRRDVS